ACIAPADPQAAAALAWMDSALDHAGGEGTYGEMFWAAVESAAFVLADPLELIRIGLAMIPPACAISRVIREVVWCWQHGIRYDDARERVTRTYWNEQPCNAIPNHGFTVAGWLYGKDFGDRLCKAVNCGFDTDCTGATLGALLGILGGTRGIPKEWSAPIGTDIVLHEFTGDCGVPRTLADLTDRTVALGKRMATLNGNTTVFGRTTRLPDELLSLLYRNEKASAALAQDVRAGSAVDGEAELFLHYSGDPVLYPGIARRMSLSCRLRGVAVQPELALLEGPAEWQTAPVAGSVPPAWDVIAPEYDTAQQLRATVVLNGTTYRASYTVLSPAEAQGYPNGVQSTAWQPPMHATPTSGKRVEIAFGSPDA
ncbi:MAG: ADP-ribosylglycohydrolase family protein, partial [Chloroflexi bacterium]|nr:ADP-ribosylglycohydrolase family protein [Chloroflexota bacterium]